MTTAVGDIRKMGLLALALLVLLVIFMLTFVLGAQFQKTLCEDIDGVVYSAGNCYTNADVNVSSESVAWNATVSVITAILLVVSFLTIIVLVALAKLILSSLKGFGM